ncbi:MAG: XRE family transcriptional regulator [Nitrospira sp.]|nr:XRE family transcriptional regulator [Nitrospira sp.]
MAKAVRGGGSPGKSRRKTQKQSGQIEQSLGEAIRRLRDSQRLSVRALASNCGFSASFISQVELNQASPSLSSLERIAAGLGTTLGQLFVTAAPSAPAPIKASHRPMLQSEWSRAQIESLSHPSVNSKLEALLITLRLGGSSGGRLHLRETELLAIVFAGTVRLQVGNTSHVLHRGDAITIPAHTLHRWENTEPKPAQLLKIVPRGHS